MVASSESHTMVVCEGEDLAEGSKDVQQHEGGVTHAAFSATGLWAVSCGSDLRVHLYNGQDLSHEALIFRSECALLSAAISPSEDLIAIADTDGLVKVTGRVDPTQVRVLKGHTGAVKSVAFDPKREYLASAGSDGLVKIWRLVDGKDAEIASLDVLPRVDAKSGNLSRLAWSPEGDYLAIPTSIGVSVVARPGKEGGDWRTLFSLSETKMECLAVTWSANGAVIASAHKGPNGGSVWLWDIASKEALNRTEYKAPVTSLAWNTKNGSLLLAASDGSIAFWNEPVDHKRLVLRAASEVAKYTESKENLNRLIDDEADEENEKGAPGGDVSDESADDRDDGEDLRDFIEDDEADRKERRKEKRRASLTTAPLDGSRRPEDSGMFVNRPESMATMMTAMDTYAVPFQKPYQVNSSDLDESAVRRYLSWNEIGNMTVRYEDNSKSYTSFLKVDFADQSAHKSISMQRDYYVAHGALGTEGIAFASQGNAEGSERAVVNYHQYANTWAANSDWSIQLAPREVIHCLAIGDTFVAIATNKYLRILSTAGNQRHIFSLKGPVVTMAASGDLLAVAYHAPAATRLSSRFILYNFATKQVPIDDILPLTNEHDVCVEWIGFTERGMLASLDSHRILRLLVNSDAVSGEWQGQWVPILEGLEAIPEQSYFWPIRITDDELIFIRCGADNQPAILPPPVPDIVKLRIPVITSVKNSDLVEQHMRELISFNQIRRQLAAEAPPGDLSWTVDDALIQAQTSLDRVALNSFRRDLGDDRTMRAYDWVTAVTLEKSLDIAAQMARVGGVSQLAERIAELKPLLFPPVVDLEEIERPAKRARVEASEDSSPANDESNDADDVMEIDTPVTPKPTVAKPSKGPENERPFAKKGATPFAKKQATTPASPVKVDAFAALEKMQKSDSKTPAKAAKSVQADGNSKKRGRLFG